MESLNGGNGVGRLPGLSAGSAASTIAGPPIGEVVDTSVANFIGPRLPAQRRPAVRRLRQGDRP